MIENEAQTQLRYRGEDLATGAELVMATLVDFQLRVKPVLMGLSDGEDDIASAVSLVEDDLEQLKSQLEGQLMVLQIRAQLETHGQWFITEAAGRLWPPYE